MEEKRSRVISLILTAVMVLTFGLSFVPDTGYREVHALRGGGLEGQGSADDPYKINNYDQFKVFANIVNGANGMNRQSDACAVLVNDIDASSSATANDWTPIGTNSTNYTGTFDGQGHTISGLKFDNGTTDDVGLFGFLGNGGVIKNVILKDCDISGQYRVGGLAGNVNGGTVYNCHVTGVVKGKQAVGGVAGLVEGGTIYNCASTCNVTGDNSGGGVYTGGIAGQIVNDTATHSYVANCYNGGSISGIGARTGGVVGFCQESFVVSCLNNGEVKGHSYKGGIAGYLTDGTIKQCRNSGMVNDSYTYNKGPFSGGVVGIIDGGTVENCFNTGIVKGGDDVGGVAGVVICNTSSQNKGNVINCYNCTGQLDAEDDTYRGGVIGRIIDSIAVNSFYDKSLLTNSRAVGYEQGVNTFNNVEGKTTTEMTGLNASAYTGWDYENIWRLTTGYPELRLFSKNYFNLVDDNIGLGLNGEITYTDPELSAGSIIKVPYNVTLNGGSAVNRISYIIAEGSYTVDDVKIKGYGKVENCDSAGSGNVYIFIPAIFDKTKDRIYLVAEHVNAEQETDHLSKPLAVYPAPGPEPTPTPTEIDVVSVALDNSLVKLECGQTYALKATVNPSDATDKTLTWKSGNKKVATVSADGRVTGVGKGTTTITATSSNGKTASCKVRVKEYKDIKRVYITPSSVHLKVGKTRTVRAIILPKKAKNKRVIWKSSNTKVATVTPVSINKAKITAVERGTAKITVTTADSKKKRSIKVIVRKK